MLHPVKMLVGMLAMLVILAVFIYVSMEGSAVYNFKKRYPAVGVLFIILSGCFLTYTLGSLIVFFLGILLPLSGKKLFILPLYTNKFCLLLLARTFYLRIFSVLPVTFVHASLRLRNIKNKVANKIESIGLKRTPMGVFLEHLGMEEEFFS